MNGVSGCRPKGLSVGTTGGAVGTEPFILIQDNPALPVGRWRSPFGTEDLRVEGFTLNTFAWLSTYGSVNV